jgi:hypothetical protein
VTRNNLLEVTGGGRARDFEGIRDHAIIRVFTEGVRRTELAQMQIEDLSADLMARPFARVVPLKGGARRQRGPGRTVHPGNRADSGRLPARAAVAQADGPPGVVPRESPSGGVMVPGIVMGSRRTGLLSVLVP